MCNQTHCLEASKKEQMSYESWKANGSACCKQWDELAQGQFFPPALVGRPLTRRHLTEEEEEEDLFPASEVA